MTEHTDVIHVESPFSNPKEADRPVIFAPPAVIVVFNTGTKAGKSLLRALETGGPSQFVVTPPGISKEAAERLTVEMREAVPRIIEAVKRGEVRAIVTPPFYDGKHVFTGFDKYVSIAGIKVPVFRFPLVRVVKPNIIMGRSYSPDGRYIYTDVVFLNETGFNVRRLYGPHYIYDVVRALRAIIPADVLRAMKEGRLRTQAGRYMASGAPPARQASYGRGHPV